MKSKGGVLVFGFVILVLAVLGFLIYLQLSEAEFMLIEKPLTKQTTLPAPISFFLNSSGSGTVEYHGHIISVDYISSSPMQVISVLIDDNEYLIEKTPMSCITSCGYYKTLDDISFKVEPVTWVENSEGKLVWSFKTWDTDQIYFEANAKAPASSGDKLL